MIIEFRNIKKSYQQKLALDNFTASLQPGVYGLLGANGAGKTTLINILVGVLKPTCGHIIVDGTDTRKLGKKFLAQIGYLSQYPQFYKDFTVSEFLRYMCALKGISKKDADERVPYLLQEVNLSNSSNQRIGSLSGGMRQRVGIVQAMLGDPKLLILDEPTAGLDPQERIRFRNLIVKFAKDRIVLLATHIVSDVDAIANQIMILRSGQLIAQDDPETLEHNLDGQVWEIVLKNELQLQEYDRFQISRLQRTNSKLQVRLLSKERPSPEASQVCANLEDVFLYYMNNQGEEGDTT